MTGRPRKYLSDEERRLARNASVRAWQKRNAELVKARQREYHQRPEVKARQHEYHQRPEVKARNREYQRRPEVKARHREYQRRPEVKARHREYCLRTGYTERRQLLARIKKLRAAPQTPMTIERLNCLTRAFELNFMEKKYEPGKPAIPLCAINAKQIQEASKQ